MNIRLSNRIVFKLSRKSFILSAVFVLSVVALLAQNLAAQTTGRAIVARAAAPETPGKWTGDYSIDSIPKVPKRRRQTGSVPGAIYNIAIEPGAEGKLVGRFVASGTRRFDAYGCSVKIVSDEKVEFYFEKIAAPEAMKMIDFKPGDLLFSLVRTQVGKEIKYLFEPAGYKIRRVVAIGGKAPRPEIYFHKYAEH